MFTTVRKGNINMIKWKSKKLRVAGGAGVGDGVTG